MPSETIASVNLSNSLELAKINNENYEKMLSLKDLNLNSNFKIYIQMTT